MLKKYLLGGWKPLNKVKTGGLGGAALPIYTTYYLVEN